MPEHSFRILALLFMEPVELPKRVKSCDIFTHLVYLQYVYFGIDIKQCCTGLFLFQVFSTTFCDQEEKNSLSVCVYFIYL